MSVYFCKRKKIANVDVLLALFPVLPATSMPPLGIAYLKSFLTKKGISCRCIDFNSRLFKMMYKKNKHLFQESDLTFKDKELFKQFCERGFYRIMDKWAEDIIKINPRFLGMSVAYKGNARAVIYITKKIRAIRPDIKIILGGPHCTLRGEEFFSLSHADVIVLGEGELTLYKLIKAIDEKKDLRNIRGIIFRKNELVIRTAPADEIEDLNLLPFPDYSDFDLFSYGSKVLPIASSRGCFGSCRFCNIHFLWPRFRYRSSENIYEEMKYLKEKYNIFEFSFNDSLINGNLNILEKLCGLIIKGEESFKWTASIRINKNMSQAIFEKMSKAGCRKLSIGLESGSEKVRMDMGKPCSDEDAKNQLKFISSAGIVTYVMMIIGYPTETRAEFYKSLNFIEKNRMFINKINFGRTCLISPWFPSEAKMRKKYEMEFDKDGNWHYKENTIKERLWRVSYAGKCAKAWGIIVEEKHKEALDRQYKKFNIGV